jgi:aromatic-amino-acid transaminase
MFSCLGATSEQVQTLRVKHGIYMVTDSRLNFAGLSQQNVERIVDAVTDVGI